MGRLLDNSHAQNDITAENPASLLLLLLTAGSQTSSLAPLMRLSKLADLAMLLYKKVIDTAKFGQRVVTEM